MEEFVFAEWRFGAHDPLKGSVSDLSLVRVKLGHVLENLSIRISQIFRQPP